MRSEVASAESRKKAVGGTDAIGLLGHCNDFDFYLG